MFLRRKRRPEEDDSLVPHGLIWHATSENSAQEQTPDRAEEKTAKIIAMPSAPAPKTPAAGDVAEKKPARGVTPFWRSLPAAQRSAVEPVAHREAPPAPVPIRSESVPVRSESVAVRKEAAPLRAQSVPVQVQSAGARDESAPARIERVPISEKIATPRSVPIARKAREVLAAALVSTRSHLGQQLRHGKESAKRAEVLVISSFGRIRERSRRSASSFKTGLSRLHPMGALTQFARQQATGMREGSRRRIEAIHRNESAKRAAVLVISSLERVRERSRRLMEAMHRPVNVNLRVRISPVMRRVRAFSWHPPTTRLRTLFRSLANEIEVVAAREIARAKLRWPELAHGREFVRRALPLTLPALLMFTLFFIVRHYATQALPSHWQRATPAEYRPAEAPPAPPVRPRRQQAKAPQPAKGAPASATKRHETPAVTRNTRPQAAAQAEEDYVAPDTYVYYGPSGKASR